MFKFLSLEVIKWDTQLKTMLRELYEVNFNLVRSKKDLIEENKQLRDEVKELQRQLLIYTQKK